MEISNLYSTSTILVEYERTTKKVPTMKPLDSDKKVSKEVSAPAEAAQTAPVVEEKSIFQCSDRAAVQGLCGLRHLLQV